MLAKHFLVTMNYARTTAVSDRSHFLLQERPWHRFILTDCSAVAYCNLFSLLDFTEYLENGRDFKYEKKTPGNVKFERNLFSTHIRYNITIKYIIYEKNSTHLRGNFLCEILHILMLTRRQRNNIGRKERVIDLRKFVFKLETELETILSFFFWQYKWLK